MKTLIVNDKFDNKKLLVFLEKSFPYASKNMFYKALRKKDIRINDIKISENILIHKGDKIDIYIADKYLYPYECNFDIVYEDDNILVVNKPKNIEVTGENSLTYFMAKKYTTFEAMPCHRLDRNTSGLVVFAKSKPCLEILLDKFKSREISKYYKTRVYGLFNKKHDILKAYLFKDSQKSLVYISDENKKGYREIVTEYTVLESDKKLNTSTLEIVLHTGRTHQIRAHMAHIGHPIIGDRKIWRLCSK